MTRRFPIGAEVLAGGGVSFRVWAPRRKKVEAVLEAECVELQPEPSGYFSGVARRAGNGARYRFRLDGGDAFPDPASRFQPEGPHGPSQVVDPSVFSWSDAAWPGASLRGQVIYELHVGTFTREGTFDAARRELPELADAGITVVELMPVADFPGRFGWGYDGVNLYAPARIYGEPDDLRRFVDDAHRVGVGVILDVVYNHVGPDGNYITQFSQDYFTARYPNEWGEAINFDGENSAPVREWVATNAAYWAEEYHLDGLRLDATQQIFDASPENIMTSLAKSMRKAAGRRKVFIVAENEAQCAKLARPCDEEGYGLDGLWNDDFHHTAMVAMTGRAEAYYSDYTGTPQELISSAKYGFLFQGQYYSWQVKRRGSPAWGLDPAQFVSFIQNHDQIANSARGERVHQLTSPALYRAITAWLLLMPSTPLLFQGQEFAASSPFFFFADHSKNLRRVVWEGRIQFLAQFPSLARPEVRPYQLDPGDPATFERCKLDFGERQRHAPVYQLHKDLLRLRREQRVFREQRPRGVDGAVLGSDALVLRYFVEGPDRSADRLVVMNLGMDLKLEPAPEPLLAPPEGMVWSLLWSSEDPRYGGAGTPVLDSGEGWRIPGRSMVVLHPEAPKNIWEI